MLKTAVAAIAAVLIIFTPLANADSHEAGTLARVWTITPKAGVSEDFEKALAGHVEWRRKNKDPWHWNVYVQVDGANFGTYYARSGGHRYADFDAYEEFGQKAGDHWNENVQKYVADLSSAMSRELPDMSQWEGNTSDYNLFKVFSIDIRPGALQAWKNAAGTIANELTEAGWPYEWVFIERVTGPLPGASLVIPTANWAGLEDPKPTAFEAIAERYDGAKAAEMWEDYYESVGSIDAFVLRRIPDLEVKAAQ